MDLLVFVPFAIALVAAVTQAAKAAGLPTAIAPLFETALGIVLAVGGVETGAVTVTDAAAAAAAVYWAILYGAVIGLSAGGLYTYAKAARDAGVTTPPSA